jgi:hypothetical protein
MLYFHSVSPFASILVCRYSYIKCHKLLWPVVNYLWDSCPQEHMIAEADKAEKALQTKFPLGPQLVRGNPGERNADDRQMFLCFIQK